MPALLALAIAALGFEDVGALRAALPPPEDKSATLVFPIGKASPRYTVIDDKQIIAEDFSDGRKILWTAEMAPSRLDAKTKGTLATLFRMRPMDWPIRLKPGVPDADALFRSKENFVVYNFRWPYYGVTYDGGKRFEAVFANRNEKEWPRVAAFLEGKPFSITEGEKWLMSGGPSSTASSRKLEAERERFFTEKLPPPSLRIGEVSMTGPELYFPAGRSDVCYAYGRQTGVGAVLIGYRKVRGVPRKTWQIRFGQKALNTPGTLQRQIGYAAIGKVPEQARRALESATPLTTSSVSAMMEVLSYDFLKSDGSSEGGMIGLSQAQVQGRAPVGFPITLAEMSYLASKR